MIFLTPPSPLAIELGEFTLSSATSSADLAWFTGGLLLLTLLTGVILWWHRRSRPDPFRT